MSNEVQVYAVKHKKLETRMASRSGGIFTAISDSLLSQNGVIYGCVLNESFEAVHVRAENAEERDRMRGSKYVQSNLGDTFRQVQNDLKDNRLVLFSGTSCQVDGLHSFLGKKYNNLFCVDIVCHGVPSPLVWKKYLEWQQKRNGTCVAVDFRNKRDFGWAAHIESLTMEQKNGETVQIDSSVFTKIFYEHSVLRPSCYHCPYKDITHPGDITIADYWGIDEAAPGFNDNKGVSLVLINNEKGAAMFEKIKGDLTWQQTKIEDSLQPPLVKPFEQPDSREEFWQDFQRYPFEKMAKKYGGWGMANKVKKKLVRIKKKLFKH